MNHTRRIPHSFKIVALVVAGLVVVWLVVQSRRVETVVKLNKSFRVEITENIKIGDPEEKLKDFVARKGWESGYDPALKGYDIQLSTGTTAMEEHFLIVHTGIEGGRVTEIKMMDFNRTL